MDSKKYTIQAKQCIKGEAFFESLISAYSIPHRVTGPEDIGIDFFCEWANDNEPAGVLFGVQIKTLNKENVSIELKDEAHRLSGLENYEISSSNLMISKQTLNYWKGLGIPIYVFVILTEANDEGEVLSCYYKRYTSMLTKNYGWEDPAFTKAKYFKVNKGHSFIAYTRIKSEEGTKLLGFARDLYMDYVRCEYSKGYISFVDPARFGLEWALGKDNIFPEFFEDYKEQLVEHYLKVGSYVNSQIERIVKEIEQRKQTGG